jgi:membrane protein required for colicin V production
VNQLDALLLVLLVPFVLRGWSRGVLREAFGVAGVVVGVLAAASIGAPVADDLAARGLVAPGRGGMIAASMVFFAVVVAANLAGRITDRFARALLLGPLVRVAGAGFGAVKGLAVLGFILLGVGHFARSPKIRSTLDHSTLAPPLAGVAHALLDAGRALRAGPAEKASEA